MQYYSWRWGNNLTWGGNLTPDVGQQSYTLDWEAILHLTWRCNITPDVGRQSYTWRGIAILHLTWGGNLTPYMGRHSYTWPLGCNIAPDVGCKFYTLHGIANYWGGYFTIWYWIGLQYYTWNGVAILHLIWDWRGNFTPDIGLQYYTWVFLFVTYRKFSCFLDFMK